MRGGLYRFAGGTVRKRISVVAGVVAGVVLLTTGGAFAMRAAGDHLASATISKLGGGDPQAVLDSIAERVVKQLTGSDGAIGEASKSITDQLSAAAGDKLAGIDADALLNQVSSEVVAAGMGKINGISTDAIVQQVTAALIERALAEIEGLDLEALAKDTLDDAVDDLLATIDFKKLISEELAKVDLQSIVSDVVSKQIGSLTGGGSTSSLLKLLLNN